MRVREGRGHTSAATLSAYCYLSRMPSKALITTDEVANLDPATLRSPLECAQLMVRLDSLIIELDSRLAYAEADDQDRAAGRTPSDQRYEPRSASWRVRADSARRWTAHTRDRVALRKAELENAAKVKLGALAGELRIIAEALDHDRLADRAPAAQDPRRLREIADALGGLLV